MINFIEDTMYVVSAQLGHRILPLTDFIIMTPLKNYYRIITSQKLSLNLERSTTEEFLYDYL